MRKVYYRHPPRERIRFTELTKDGKLMVTMAWGDKRSDEFYAKRAVRKRGYEAGTPEDRDD